ncbi:MAG: DUF4191 family protein [Actinobacteria bacterium]|uniref:Unannotated protein n=1 Tax=freshwater metagenome TaxID=449393 RepID=A0A6J5YKC9_9ZZZZ|nr:DUF4191 family protein [Actinomycetota bacterium]
MSTRSSEPKKQRWWTQIRETYSFTKPLVRFLALKLFVFYVVVFASIIGIGIALNQMVVGVILGFSTSLLATAYRFGKIAEKAAYRSLDGQLGAAASVLNALRRGWTITPGVGVDKNQNLVHRAVGRPGIVLVAEGSRPESLLIEQRRAHARYVPGVPIHEVIVGGATGIELTDLQKNVRKLKKSLRPAEVTELRRRLEALPKNVLPIPKGPMPQGRKIPRR